MKTFIVSPRRTYEVVSYDPVIHRAVLRKEDGELVIDSNFWPEMVKRAGYILKQQES